MVTEQVPGAAEEAHPDSRVPAVPSEAAVLMQTVASVVPPH